MDERKDDQTGGSINRRRFIGALGAAAVGGAILQSGGGGAEGAGTAITYQDSFGNVVPANPKTLALGIMPPEPGSSTLPLDGLPQCDPGQSGTYYTCGYPYYNILFIMVDQWRSSLFWPPGGSGGQQSLWNATPNVTGLMNQSYVFQNYFTCGNKCSPARSTLLTGLYAQQTCMFETQEPGMTAPSLLPYNPNWAAGQSAGFPTIGNVLSQVLPIGAGTGGNLVEGSYDTAWIGKWHVSCETGTADGTPGAHGPHDYGFANPYNIPTLTQYPPHATGTQIITPTGFPSPNGILNEGNGGDFLDSLQTSVAGARDVPKWGATSNPSLSPIRGLVQLNDSAIATAFIDYWLPNEPANTGGSRWFCAVSFVNPHDMSYFPWAFGIVGESNPVTCDSNTDPTPSWCTALTGPAQTQGYQSPPPSATQQPYPGSAPTCSGAWCAYDDTTIPGLPSLYTAATTPSGWNNGVAGDDPILNPYGYNSGAYGKPGLQAYYESQVNYAEGTMHDQAAWLVFLNYYVWLEASVDLQVGNVLNALANSPQGFANNTVIVFTSDHGEYGGSHNLHGKGGALYDEALNVPFLVSFPSQRGLNGYSAQTTPVWLPYVCSSVNVLPFLYTLALGNDSWRLNSNDIIHYLNGRESMMDAIMSSLNPVPQHRLSGIPLHMPFTYQGQTQTQPYILSTTDEYSAANIPNMQTAQPSHAIAFRTVNVTDSYANPNYSGLYMYGGGKLGIYSFWDVCNPQNTMTPVCSAPILPDPNPPQAPSGQAQQFEFYNYSPHPYSGITIAVNPGETGNQAFTSASGFTFNAQALLYTAAFNGTASTPPSPTINQELYYPNFPANGQLLAAVQQAFEYYVEYLESTPGGLGCHTGQSSNCPPPP